MKMKSLWLQTTDGDGPQKVHPTAMYCPLICKEVIEHGKGLSDGNAVELPACISTSILKLIMDYCRFHDIPDRSEEECKVFNDKFIYKDKSTLCDLGAAAISLGLTPLLDLTLDELQRQTKGQNCKQVSKIFHRGKNPFNMDYSRYEFMNKFFDRKKQEAEERLLKVDEVVERPEDVRPIDELLQYINGKDADKKGATTNKKKKKNKRKKEEANNLCSTNTNDFDDEFDDEFDDRLKMEIIDRDVEEFERILNLSWEERRREMMHN